MGEDLPFADNQPDYGAEFAVLSMKTQISIVTVTHNSASCIRDCVASIQAQTGIGAEVIVVDNASSDNTLQVLAGLGSSVEVIANGENIGFGRACNQGVAASQGELLFLLNPDAKLEQTDGLARACSSLLEHPRWGLAGTHVLSSDGLTDNPPATSYPEQNRANCSFSHLPGHLAWVLGASMLIRREAFEAVGGFDPGFFLSSEETDLCLRMRQQGWEIGYVADVDVLHVGMASERGYDPYDTSLRRMEGMLRFWSKHYPPEVVQRLALRDLFRTRFRMGWYFIMSRFSAPSSNAMRKYRRYRGISEASRRFLHTGPRDHKLYIRPESEASLEP